MEHAVTGFMGEMENDDLMSHVTKKGLDTQNVGGPMKVSAWSLHSQDFIIIIIG